MPEGTVTFLFSDVEGSTALLEGHGEASTRALRRHIEIFEELVDTNRGVIFETVGDAVYAAFANPPDALTAALAAHRALATEGWEEVGGRLACRIAVHTGSVERRDTHYFGPPLFRCARLQALAYGEQTVVSGATAGLVNGSLPSGATLVDRGVHRLKDLQEPEHVFELQHPDLRTEFPPLKSLDARPHNLPVQLSSFVGREDELATVSILIREHRLVTLLGPGGIGKTRLALQAGADQIEQFTDGVWFVDLAPLHEASRIAQAIAAALGVREESGATPLHAVADHMRSRKLLLILDNLEQLLPDASSVIAELLAGAPGLHVLATSRGPLRLRGEVEHQVPPLGAGDPAQADLQLPDAVALFLARAREIHADLIVDSDSGPLIAAICERLDGLPLAIELAAARLRLFTLQALRDRLEQRLPVLVGGARDLPERQQTLTAAIAWSEELLAVPERALFHRVGVFVGGFSLGEAAAVAGSDLGTDAEAGLMTLLEQSRVRRLDGNDEPRFAMLETIREYAVGQLRNDGGEDAARDRMAEWICKLVSIAPDELLGLRQMATLRLMDAELPNIRATLEWLRDRGDIERLPALAGDLARYWTMRGLRREGIGWVRLAAPLVSDAHSPARAHLYRAEGLLLNEQEPSQALAAFEAAIAIYRETGDRRELGRCLLGLSLAYSTLHDPERSHEAAEEALAIAREVGDLRTEAAAIGNIAWAAGLEGRVDEAEEGILRSNELSRQVGDLHGVVIGLSALGVYAAQRGDLAAAVAQHLEAVEVARQIGDPELIGLELLNLVQPNTQMGHWQRAIAPWLEGIGLLQKTGVVWSQVASLSIATSILHAGGDTYGAGRSWAMANALAVNGVRLQSFDIDEAVVAALRAELGDSYTDIEREVAGISLDEAVAQTIDRVKALPTT